MPGATLMRSVGRVVGLNKSRRNEERMRLFVGRKKVGSFVRVGEGGGWVPDKGSLMVFGGWAGSSTQEPCRGFAAPSDQSPSHKSASAWPSARSTSEAAVKRCRSGAKNKQHAGWACRGQARQRKKGGCAGRGRRPPRIYRKCSIAGRLAEMEVLCGPLNAVECKSM
jgi:hypothetical protein